MLKKKILLLVLSALVLIGGCFSYIFAVGDTYTYSLWANDSGKIQNVQVNIDDENVLNVDKIRDKEILFKSVNKGTTMVTVNYDLINKNDKTPMTEMFEAHTTRLGTVINKSHFDFNGYFSIIISAFIYLLIVFAIVIQSTRASFKENWYSYKNMVYIGLIIFLVLLMLIFGVQCGIYFNTSSNFGLMNFISNIVSSGQYVMFSLVPLLSILFLLISVSNMVLIFREGKSVKNILGVILGIVFIVAAFVSRLTDIVYNNYSSEKMLYATTLLGGFISYMVVYFDCIFLGACICSLMASFRKPHYDRDYIIILGCGLRKDGSLLPLLKGRVDSAISFVKKQRELTKKNCIFVPSGGQGNDEIIAEGDAMKNYLLQQGIEENNIMVENKSTTTLENMQFSKKLIDEKNPNAKVAFSTTRYHLFRSGMYATTAGLNAIGVGSKTKWYFWPNAFLREFVGVLVAKIKYHLVTAGILFLINVLLVSTGALIRFL